MKRPIAASVFLFCTLLLGLPPASAQSWKVLTSGVDSNLRGISAAKIPPTGGVAIWACGSHGVILRSLDDGATWVRADIAGERDLDFRGIVAFSDTTAYLMASGEGDKSRLYKTSNGGATWELQYTRATRSFFLDAIACFSDTKCLALGDPLDGKFLLLETTDGQHWTANPRQNLPPALLKEAAFAASNSSLLVPSGDEFFVVTGGFAARLLHTSDHGKTWNASLLPIAADNASSGVFSIAGANGQQFVAVGGDYANPTMALRTAATSSDRGKSWQAPQHGPSGYRSAVVRMAGQTFLAVGPTGADISQDAGLDWTILSSLPLNALCVLDAQHTYAAGPKGTITQFVSAESK